MKLKSILIAMTLVGTMSLSTAQGKKDTAIKQSQTVTAIPVNQDTNVSSSTRISQAQDIIAVAASDADFSTLVAAIKSAGLVETLQGEGPFTVFAPVNSAFEALPAGTVNNLLKKENIEQLQAILKYHVVAGKIDAATLIALISDNDGSYTIETVQGDALIATVSDGQVVLTDSRDRESIVVSTDVAASNGIIHAIDTVALPQE